MKKFLIGLLMYFIFILLYFIQADFFNWFTIAGVGPNIFIIFILFLGLFTDNKFSICIALLTGITLDLVIGKTLGVTAIMFCLVAIIANYFDKNFSKDSRMTIMFMVSGATIIFEVLKYFLNYIFLATNVEIFNFIIILIIETIYNVIMTIILYPLIQKFGYYIENEYKGNKILTRYF